MDSTLDILRDRGGRLLKFVSRLIGQADTIALAPLPITPVPNPPAFENPGNLVLHTHVPAGLGPNAPLVVLLHGCGQDPESFATDTGWRALADRFGFVLLMPGQTDANNPQRCFNWFRPADTTRDHGEAASIAAMTRHACAQYGCAPEKVYATGLSAGGAMTACVLAAYPDLFTAGAIAAGLPAASAGNVVNAMARMSGRGRQVSAADWAARARALAPPLYQGRWPSLSIWQGTADPVVAPINATLLVEQWTTLLGTGAVSTQTTPAPGITHQSWGKPGQTVELWTIADAGHVYPTFDGQGISAAAEIAKFWGICA